MKNRSLTRPGSFVRLWGCAAVFMFAAACTNEDPDPAGAGGESAAAPGGDGGAAEPGIECPSRGSGTLVVEIEGLPEGIDSAVSLDGPTLIPRASGTSSVEAGIYVATAARVYDDDPIVRTVYAATIASPSFCMKADATYTLRVRYAPIPSSNKLWMSTGKDDELAGFSSADIAETVKTEASVSIDTTGAGSLAFDRDGNLWAVGPIIGEDMLVRIPASELGESGARQPDLELTLPELTEFPYIKHIAFDPLGNLWLSASGDQLHRLNTADLLTSGEKTSDVLFTEVINNQGIAFDSAGNLWVAGGPTIARFDRSRLDLSDTDPPDLQLEVSAALADTRLAVDELAFDKAGNLWGVAGTTVLQLAGNELGGSGLQQVKANVSFDVDVLSLPSTPAFDDGNGLWVSLVSGSFGRFAPETLGQSKPAGTAVAPDVRITSDSISAGLPIALFPAPAGLPLYHSLPTE